VPGGNHGVSLNGDSCVDKKLATYLGTGVLPGGPGGTTTCPGPPRPQP
jgi:hypothetical protein